MTDKKIGILDPEGIYNNPFTDKPYSETYKNLAKVWSKFPAYTDPEGMIGSIRDNNVILVISGTGSGKTVLFPKYVMHALDYKGRIAITLPKQIIAKSAAKFASETLDLTLGMEVGYQYRGSGKEASGKDTRMLYCTDGTLVARLLTDPLIMEFDAVIIDEAHERKVNIDFLLYLLKNVLKNRPTFKLVIMSATINQDIFREYYKDYKYTEISIGTKPNYPIESIFLDSELNINKNEYMKKGVELIRKLLKDGDDGGDGGDGDGGEKKKGKKGKKGKNEKNESNKGGILFFVTSVSETNDLCDELASQDVTFKDNNICVPVFSGMDDEQQKIATDKDYYRGFIKNGRKIIVATNVAESSLTIEGIEYVIDSGLELRSRFDPIDRINILEKTMITHAQAKQRMGRTGRTGAGTCYHLYTKQMFDHTMDRFPAPAIRKESIGYELIRLLAIPIIGLNEEPSNGDKRDVTVGMLRSTLNQFIEPPAENYIKYELEYLKNFDLITTTDDSGYLTVRGKQVVDLQLDPAYALTLMMAYRLNCFREVSAIIATTDTIKNSIGDLFTLPANMSDNGGAQKGYMKNLEEKFKKSKKIFENKYGDHISILKIFQEYELRMDDRDKLKDWAYKHFLKRHILDNSYDMYDRMKKRYRYQIAKYNLKRPDESILKADLKDRILASLYYGSKQNVLLSSNGYLSNTKRTIKNIQNDKNSFLQIDLKKNDRFFYNQLFQYNQTPIKAKIISSIPESVEQLLQQIANQSDSNDSDQSESGRSESGQSESEPESLVKYID
jgi:HrpA-like RNA helicase